MTNTQNELPADKSKLMMVSPPIAATDRLLSRELSQIAFNRRVLAQAEDPTIPLLERLRYLCIVSSNLDEFFEVRIASLLARDRSGGDKPHLELKKSLKGTSPE